MSLFSRRDTGDGCVQERAWRVSHNVSYNVAHGTGFTQIQGKSVQHTQEKQKPRRPCKYKVSGVWRGRRDLNPMDAVNGRY